MKTRAQVQLGGVGGRSVPHKAKHDEISAGTYTYVKIKRKSESNKHEMILLCFSLAYILLTYLHICTYIHIPSEGDR